MSQPAAGWYPDPVGSQRLRWWNGDSWTEQYQPMPTQQQRMPQQGIPHQGMPQHGMQTQGFPQQGMGQQAPMQAMPTGAPNPGAPASAQAAVVQGASAQQTSAPVGPHLPSNTQAPTVSSSPYGSEPTFNQPKKDARDNKAANTKTPKKTSRWNLATVAVWAAVVIFGVTTIIAGSAYSHARTELTPAVQERDEAQRQYDQAQKELDQAKKELEELQQ